MSKTQCGTENGKEGLTQDTLPTYITLEEWKKFQRGIIEDAPLSRLQLKILGHLRSSGQPVTISSFLEEELGALPTFTPPYCSRLINEFENLVDRKLLLRRCDLFGRYALRPRGWVRYVIYSRSEMV